MAMPGVCHTQDTGCCKGVVCAAYCKSIRNARRMGALTGFAHGTSAAKDPHAQGTLRLQEDIIECVTFSMLLPHLSFMRFPSALRSSILT